MANTSKKLFFYGFHGLQSRTSIFASRSTSSSSSSLPRRFFSKLSPSESSLLGTSNSRHSSDLASFLQLWRRLCFHSNPCSSPGISNLRRSCSIPSKLPSLITHGGPAGSGRGLGIRLFTSKNIKGQKFDANAVISAAAKHLTVIASTASNYRQAAGLQVEAFWKGNYRVLVGALGFFLCFLLWRIMFGIATVFVGLSQSMAKYGFLALASAMVDFAYDIKLLPVDIPMATGPDQRIFLIGDEKEYMIGGGLISELRDPIVKAMAAEKEFEELDQREEEEDAERELQDAERKQRKDIRK